MKRTLLTVLALLLAGGACLAGLSIDGDLKGKRDKIVRLTAKGQQDGSALIWDVSDEDKCDVEEVNGKLLLVAPPGSYKVKCRAIKLDKDGKTTIETARVMVIVEGDTPTPPVPPGPDPKPPTPDPNVVVPIEGEGLRVLIIYESSELSKIPKPQNLALYAKSPKDYLNKKCVKGGWNIWSSKEDVSLASKRWQDAMKRAKSNKDFVTPYILISTGKRGYEGPFPKDTDSLLALLKKFGGE